MRAGAAGQGVTARLAQAAADLRFEVIDADSLIVARQCLMDWLGVAFAARDEPLVGMLMAEALEECAVAPACTLIGQSRAGSVAQAVLINGAMGHALDYDDVLIEMGHPSVPVAPVVMALGQSLGRDGRAMLAAFVAGIETETRVARFMGPSHYARGFHGTATFGAFGAAAAAGHLLGLDAARMRTAFGIAGTQAAGLKCAFGTMAKPLHAGLAARAGLLAARLAARGFTAASDILEGGQGLGATQSDATDEAAALAPAPRGFWVRETLFKYHAACYLTHSAIGAAMALRRQHGLSPDGIEAIEIGLTPGHVQVCGIADPATGLECKFSIAMVVALALSGEDLADEALFSDATAARGDLAALRARTVLRPRDATTRTLSDVTLRLRDGRMLRAEHDVAVPAADLDAQWVLLTAKFQNLTGALPAARIAEVVGAIRSAERFDAAGILLA